MFLNIQPIIVPYILAVDINKYVDNVGLTLSTTGSYYVLQYANDPFNIYPTGFCIYVSGTGYWQGSGYAAVMFDFIYDNYASYLTGFNSGILLSGNLFSGRNIVAPLSYSGMMTSNVDYMYDNYMSYPTGLFVQQFLINGNQISGYFDYYPNLYSGLFNFLTSIKTGTATYNSIDNANSNFIWSGSGINVNPGAGFAFPYLQFYAPNSKSSVQGGTGGSSSSGPFYAATTGTLPYPWTGGGPVLVGNTAVDQINPGPNQLLKIVSGGYVSLSGFGPTGTITGDFTISIIWNWEQNLTPNSYNSWSVQNPLPPYNGPQYFEALTGIGTGNGTATQIGQAFNTVYLDAQPANGGPYPSAINMGLDYQLWNTWLPVHGLTFGTPTITCLNQETSLVDWDMLSGFAIYIYTSMWSGNTWTGPVTGQIIEGGNFTYNFPQNFYTGITSGLMSNVYAFVLGNKISGSLITTNPPTGYLLATGITAVTGAFVRYQSLSTGFYTETGWFGGVTGIVANGPMAQFTGFGFGIAQYITLTRSGTLVSIYQSGLLAATGYASGALNVTAGPKPILIGEFNRRTGVFTGCYSGFGLYHFEIWNYCQNQQTISNNLLIYTKPPQTGLTTYNSLLTGALISSTNFVFT